MTHSFNDLIFKTKQILKDDIQFGDPFEQKAQNLLIASRKHADKMMRDAE